MYIYKITNNINGKIYVGKTVKSIKRRFWEHKNNAKKGVVSALYNAIRKYGEGNFSIDVLEECSSTDDLNKKEKYYIKELNTITNIGWGYNQTYGGDGGATRNGMHNNDYQKQKLREYNKTKDKTSFVNGGIKTRYKKGNIPWFYDDPVKKVFMHYQTKAYGYKCLETGKIYGTTKEAEEDTGDSYNKIRLYCAGKYIKSDYSWEKSKLNFTWEKVLIPKNERFEFWSKYYEYR